MRPPSLNKVTSTLRTNMQYKNISFKRKDLSKSKTHIHTSMLLILRFKNNIKAKLILRRWAKCIALVHKIFRKDL